MATYTPSIYEYETAEQWQQAMNEWDDENEPKEPVAIVKEWAVMSPLWYNDRRRRIPEYQVKESFDTIAERDAWIREKEAEGLFLVDKGESIENLAEILRDVPIREAPLWGGTREEYRALGLTRF